MGRLAGPGALKGGSPIPPQRQAENAIGMWLRADVTDSAGALRAVLQRHLNGSEQLLDNVENPLSAAEAYCRQVLASEHRLRELVREADVEWGRTMGERPHFDRQGSLPDAHDPYTLESVRKSLEDALQRMGRDEAG